MIKEEDIMTKIKDVGGHYAMTNRYKHPSTRDLMVEKKRGKQIFDISRIFKILDTTLKEIEEIAKKKGVILFVSTRQETVDIIKKTAENLELPHMLNRWIGGTLSNFKNIKKRVDVMKDLKNEREDGKWAKHIKKEIVLLNRKLAKLENKFSGIENMEALPAAIFVLDTRKEKIVVDEAKTVGIPVIGFSNADANIKEIDYPIIANIHSRNTVEYIMSLVEDTYKNAK